jgi:hypothetical protein
MLPSGQHYLQSHHLPSPFHLLPLHVSLSHDLLTQMEHEISWNSARVWASVWGCTYYDVWEEGTRAHHGDPLLLSGNPKLTPNITHLLPSPNLYRRPQYITKMKTTGNVLYRNTEELWRKNCCRGKAILHSRSVSVALVIQPAKRMLRILLPSVASSYSTIFFHISQKAQFLEKA